MKKYFFVGLMTFAAVSVMAQVQPATFENEAGGIQLSTENPVWRGLEPLQDDENEWTSGDFTFTTFQDDWGSSGIYYYDVTASNLQNTTFDWANPYFDQYSAAGEAAEGDNYGVWYYNMYGSTNVVLNAAAELSGMAVTNNTYVLNAILNGDGMSEEEGGKGLPFHAGDYFKLIVTGYFEGAEVAEVEFFLADFRDNSEAPIWQYAENWQWVDLSSLGTVDELGFAVETTKHNGWGGTTPSYFCFDNLGGNAADCKLGEMTKINGTPTSIANVENAVSVEKVIRNGQLFILRNGVMYNINGAVVR